MKYLIVFIWIVFNHSISFSGGKCPGCMRGDDGQQPSQVQRPLPQNQRQPSVEQYVGTDIMIVGAHYEHPSYKTLNRQNPPYLLVDIDTKPTGLRHNITNPFVQKYHGKFKTIVFEQLPFFAINQQSLQNILDLLKPDGQISMNCPFNLQEANNDFDDRPPDYTLPDRRSLWKHHAFLAFKSSNVEEFSPATYQGEDYLQILQHVIPILFNREFGILTNKIQVVQYGVQHQGVFWFKNKSPNYSDNPIDNRPYLVIIDK